MDGDFELVKAWQAGDDEAGDALVKRHFWGVYRFFRNKVDDAAEDLAQRTFLACMEARGRVRPELSFRAYLFGIARNQLMLYLRRHHRSAHLFEPTKTSVADLRDSRADVKLVRNQQQRALLLALRQIPVDFQIAVELYYWEELSVSEVAAVLDVAPGTVKSRLARARDKLRERLEQLELPEATLRSTLSDLEGWARSLRDAHGLAEHRSR
ncbi:RNA polymerase sigma factor [Paraliomyxa miuraensis]|uniref:RNA polymerase sigma factor n=1 Tax=Paraliomyxa miuraensis TaxID=376150 RepID=UPI002255BE92|nr:sigma-70 family RNA polymerase sigma factor [Paraliomyxa miuraensis]MCX4243274.1 sigma-70 family RNA polymerase sigma factor [Paraliomyxa miuraensis]